MKRWIAVGSIVVGVGLVGYALLARDTDQELIRARLDQLTTAVRVERGENALLRAARMRRAFDEVLAPDIVVHIPDLPGLGRGRDALLGAAVQAGRRYRTADADLSDISVHLDTQKRTADVQSEATLTTTGASGPHRDTRHVLFHFTRTENGWRISSLQVSASPDLPPAARQ